MSRYQRMMLRLALALFAVSAAMVGTVLVRNPLSAPTAHAACGGCTGTFYGGFSDYMNRSINNGIWPQATGNACGVENAIAMVNYDDVNNGQPVTFADSSGQTRVENDNQTSGQSQWGYAKGNYPGTSTANGQQGSINKWAGETNIAPDLGTDPRSIAYMAWNYSLPNRFFHNYIYSWNQDVNGSTLSFQDQVLHATTKVAVALEAYTEPVSVTINGGLHSVIVSGIWSGNDPATSYPAQIQGLVYRDPEGDYVSGRQEIDYSVWVNGGYSNQFGTYSLWSLYYGDSYSVGDHKNTGDPEPSVGPYVPGVRYPTHWYDNLTWIRLDNNYANGLWSPDIAFNAVSGQNV